MVTRDDAVSKVMLLRGKYDDATAAGADADRERLGALHASHGNRKAHGVTAIDSNLTELRATTDEAFGEMAGALVDLHIMGRTAQHEMEADQPGRDIQV